MAINNVTLNNGVQNIKSTMVTTADNESKNLENQIASKQQRLNRLSSDEEMTAEEKAKERQEVQKQIAELNRKLRLLRMEQKEEAREAKEEQEKKAVLKEEILVDTVKKEQKEDDSSNKQKDKIESISPPVENIQKMLVADSLLQQGRVQESVARQKDGKENILEAEIKADEIYGIDTSAKKEELSKLRKKENFEIEVQEQPNNQKPFGMEPGSKIIIKE